MKAVPCSPNELKALNSPEYRTLNALFERLNQTHPELNTALLEVIDHLNKPDQVKLLAILYHLECDRSSLSK